MTALVILTLAVLGSWDISRRLLPVRVPVVLGKLACVMIAWALITAAPHVILFSLAVPGALMVLQTVIKPEPNVPWWAYVNLPTKPKAGKPGVQAQPPASGVGHRIPRV